MCVTTADQAFAAVAAGADRLELCSALEVGGVTPSPGTFSDVRTAASVPVVVLVRPRSGGFVYTRGEFATLCRDADWFLANGAAAIVSGALDEAGRLHREQCRQLVRLARGKAVLHRAFDALPDQAVGLEEAIDLGFSRVLTSGGARTAPDGADAIRTLVESASGRIEVLAGGGVTPTNVVELIRLTGCDQVHGSFRSADPSTVAAVRAAMDLVTAR